MDLNTVLNGAAWIGVFLFSTVCHEAAHAFAAWKLGDSTAYEGGQVSLDPMPHIRREPMGMLLLPVLSYASHGWVMGWASTPYDPVWAARHSRRATIMSFAGPAANFLLVLVAAAAIHAGIYWGYFYQPESINFTRTVSAHQEGIFAALAKLISILFTENLVLMSLNLLPLPPLDGSAVYELVLPKDTAARIERFFQSPVVKLLGLFLAWELFDIVFDPIHTFSLNLLYPGSSYS